MKEAIMELLSVWQGHFLLESGHHGSLWLDLETLCFRPQLLQIACVALAVKLEGVGAEVICGPLVEGAFVGFMIALQNKLLFTYSERFTRSISDGLFPSGYRIPTTLRGELRGKRVAVVNDVINAGSAVKGTFTDLEACGATIVAISTLLTLGDAAVDFAACKRVPLINLAAMPNDLWIPEECPLCASRYTVGRLR